MTETISISNLIQDLSTRSGRAILSQLGLRSPALREYLAKLYAREPGEPGSLLADPVLEAAFSWNVAEADMEALADSGLLRDELVSAMDNPPREFRQDYRFPRNRKPFQHQLECGGISSATCPSQCSSRAAPALERPSASSCRFSRTSSGSGRAAKPSRAYERCFSTH